MKPDHRKDADFSDVPLLSFTECVIGAVVLALVMLALYVALPA